MSKKINNNTTTINNNTEKEMPIMKTNTTKTNETINNANNNKGEIIMTKEQEILEKYARLTETDDTLMPEDINDMMAKELNELKEEITMKTAKKDYTLNGTINATTWQEFRKVMKDAGINTGTKSYDQLVEEYKSLTVTDNTAVTVSVGDISEDKFYPELQEEKPQKKTTITIDKKHGDYLVKQIVKASFVATKGDSKGQRILTMHKLFGIIKAGYANKNEQLDEAFIKDIINQLITLKYICFKKYESGAMIFYPTTKTAEYVKSHK